jgi:hypothetical protein
VRTLPLRCVVDTNVCTTANGANAGAPPDCVVHSGRALKAVIEGGHVFIDDANRIVDEYRKNLNPKGQPGVGDMFFKWLLTHQWGQEKVSQVTLTPREDDEEDFEELPKPTGGTRYDRSDQKFLAVSAAHAEHPPILQSFDSKWWGWQAALAKASVQIVFLCEGEIKQKHAKKMSR